MSGKYNTCQANIKRVHPLTTYVHCGVHVTHLVTSKAAQTSTVVRNVLNSVQELGTLYKESGEFKDLHLRGNDRIETYISNKMIVTEISRSSCLGAAFIRPSQLWELS